MVKSIFAWLLRISIAVVFASFLFTGLRLIRSAVVKDDETELESFYEIVMEMPSAKVEQQAEPQQTSDAFSSPVDLAPGFGSLASQSFQPDLSQATPESGSSPTLAIYSENSVDNAARIIHRVAPEYPTLAKRLKEEGVVTVEFLVTKNGQVTSLRVIETPSSRLAEATLEALKQWRFSPALVADQPVVQRTKIGITFSLEG